MGFLHSHSTTFGSLVRIIDALLLALTLLISVILNDAAWQREFMVAMMFSLFIAPVVLQAVDAYRPWRTMSFLSEAKVLLSAWLIIIMVLASLGVASQSSSVFSNNVLATWAFLALLSVLLIHSLRRLLLHRLRLLGRNSRRAVVIGAGQLGNELAKRIDASPWMGIKLYGFFDDNPHATPYGTSPLLGDCNSVLDYINKQRIDLVYIALPMRAEARMIDLVKDLQNSTCSVHLIPDIFIFDLLQTRINQVGDMPILSLCESPISGYNQWLKSTEDIVLASLILILISPLLLLIAILIKRDSPGSVIFKQRRYGLHGEEVVVWKFRSMRVCEDSGDIKQATKNDPRTTSLGAFLRRSSMDELPQFFNVLQGRMSIVGPRPHAVAHNEHYRSMVHAYMWRHKVKPGITGWAQVNGWRGETDTLYKMEKRIEYDLWYIRHWSLWLDAKIIWRTIVSEVLKRSKNAY